MALQILRIFDVNQPSSSPVEMMGATAGIRCAHWLNNDNLILAACGDQKNLSVWDVRTSSIVQVVETEAPPTSIDVSPDGEPPLFEIHRARPAPEARLSRCLQPHRGLRWLLHALGLGCGFRCLHPYEKVSFVA